MTDLRLPPDRFVFAELRSERRTLDSLRPNRIHELLLYQLEPRTPIPVDDMHACFVRVGPGSVLACAMPKATLRTLTAEHPLAERLSPSELPDWLGPESGMIDPSRFNLFAGEFTPSAVRARRGRSQLRVASMLLLSAIILSVGLHRRATLLRDTAATLRQETQAEAASTLLADPSSPRLHALLAAELHRLRATRLGPAIDAAPTDTTRLAAVLLANWPANTQTQRLTVGEAGVSVVVRCRSADEAASLIETLGAAQGWSLTNQTVKDVQGEYEVQLTLAADKEAAS